MREREYLWMGLKSDGTIAAGETREIHSQPQVPFRGERLMVWSACAEQFQIDCVTVGVRIAMVSCNPIPASAFATRMDRLAMIDEVFKRDGVITISVKKGAEELLGMPFTLPLAIPGCYVSFVVTNLGSYHSTFLAGLMGRGD